MADTFAEIPDRDVFKASEVCEIAKLQPYVLRSWEKEFPGLGVERSPGGPRFYRRADVEQVLRIRQLVFGEGLTLAGARRRIEDNGGAPDVVDELPALVNDDTRARLSEIKRELRSLLDMLENARSESPAAAAAAESSQPSLLEGEPAAVWPPKGHTRRRRAASRLPGGGDPALGEG